MRYRRPSVNLWPDFFRIKGAGLLISTFTYLVLLRTHDVWSGTAVSLMGIALMWAISIAAATRLWSTRRVRTEVPWYRLEQKLRAAQVPPVRAASDRRRLAHTAVGAH